MFKKFLEKMRNKSEIEKRAFAFWVSSLFTLIVLAFWLFNSFYLAGDKNSENYYNNQANVFSVVFGGLKDIFDTSKLPLNQ